MCRCVLNNVVVSLLMLNVHVVDWCVLCVVLEICFVLYWLCVVVYCCVLLVFVY